MTAKKLDEYIVKTFKNLGFNDDEIKSGCWLLTRKNRQTGEDIAVAWIAYHKFLERVALMAGIVFDEPKVFNLEKNEIALYVNGHKGNFSAWAIGEASDLNLTVTSKAYRWAMAEKRAKDRVILKLLGIAGDVYSEEESDDFKKEADEFKKDAIKEKTATTKAINKAVKDGTEYVKPASEKSLEDRYKSAKAFLDKQDIGTFKTVGKSVIDSLNNLISDLDKKGCAGWRDELKTRYESLVNLDDKIVY